MQLFLSHAEYAWVCSGYDMCVKKLVQVLKSKTKKLSSYVFKNAPFCVCIEIIEKIKVQPS
jgi:hypothetical protein